MNSEALRQAREVTKATRFLGSNSTCTHTSLPDNKFNTWCHQRLPSSTSFYFTFSSFITPSYLHHTSTPSSTQDHAGKHGTTRYFVPPITFKRQGSRQWQTRVFPPPPFHHIHSVRRRESQVKPQEPPAAKTSHSFTTRMLIQDLPSSFASTEGRVNGMRRLTTRPPLCGRLG